MTNANVTIVGLKSPTLCNNNKVTYKLEGVFRTSSFFIINNSMATTLDRQPDKLDYLSPTQFRFVYIKLPKVNSSLTSVNIPTFG